MIECNLCGYELPNGYTEACRRCGATSADPDTATIGPPSAYQILVVVTDPEVFTIAWKQIEKDTLLTFRASQIPPSEFQAEKSYELFCFGDAIYHLERPLNANSGAYQYEAKEIAHVELEERVARLFATE